MFEVKINVKLLFLKDRNVFNVWEYHILICRRTHRHTCNWSAYPCLVVGNKCVTHCSFLHQCRRGSPWQHHRPFPTRCSNPSRTRTRRNHRLHAQKICAVVSACKSTTLPNPSLTQPWHLTFWHLGLRLPTVCTQPYECTLTNHIGLKVLISVGFNPDCQHLQSWTLCYLTCNGSHLLQ